MSSNAETNSESKGGENHTDVIVVGAGFSGMYLLHLLRQQGLKVKVLEAGDGVGGTWYWNRYPGARCDVPSVDYSYSWSEELQQEWTWSERYAGQAEILRYCNYVADKFDLRRDIKFSTRVVSAQFDEKSATWTVTTQSGELFMTKYFVMATGNLSVPSKPKLEGIDNFKGKVYHTSEWPHEGIDFTGKRVAVVGSGATGVQAIPVIAEQAEHLTVLQRTPTFTVPAHNAPLDNWFARTIKMHYPYLREKARQTAFGVYWEGDAVKTFDLSDNERRARFESRWNIGGTNFAHSFTDTVTDMKANEAAADFVREKIRQIVKDPKVADKLIPRDHPIGAKRLPRDTNYYETFNRENVTLVDIRATPITAVTAGGLETTQDSFEFDVIVFATGFDAMTGALLAVDIRGANNESLRDKWAAGPRSYLGLMTAGFPNMFFITGPGSPSVLSNVIVSIEQHVGWVNRFIASLERDGVKAVDVEADAEDKWVEHVNEIAEGTLYQKANSWYMGANIPGKPRVFMPYAAGVSRYRMEAEAIEQADYLGFKKQLS